MQSDDGTSHITVEGGAITVRTSHGDLGPAIGLLNQVAVLVATVPSRLWIDYGAEVPRVSYRGMSSDRVPAIANRLGLR